MKQLFWLGILLIALVTVVGAQRSVRDYPKWETRVLSPREVSPARYRQVEDWELVRLENEGWELVSVAPFALQNEERGPEGKKQVVTQVYPAYYFKRLKPVDR